MKLRAMVTVKGLVQGVAFRQSAQQAALRLNINGWVKNLANGSVQGCFEGEAHEVKALIDWCRRGPSNAMVSDVLVEMAEFTGEFDGFQIAR